MDEASPQNTSLSYSSAASPEHISRVDQAIRRYEDEIQSICRNNAQLRASLQSKSSSQPRSDASDSFRYGSMDARKLQLRVQTLEDYVETLEQRLKGPPGSSKQEKEGKSEEIQALRRTATALSEENEGLRKQVESLSAALKIAEQRLQHQPTEHSFSREPTLQETVAALKAELAKERQDKEKLEGQCSLLQSQSQQLEEQFEAMRNSQSEKPMFDSANSEELGRYKAIAQEQETGKAMVEQRLHDFIRESEQMQEDLKSRIQVLESRQQLRTIGEKPTANGSSKRSKPRRNHTSQTSQSRDSRSKSASRQRSKSPYPDEGVHFSCPKCIRKHSKEHLRKSISP